MLRCYVRARTCITFCGILFCAGLPQEHCVLFPKEMCSVDKGQIHEFIHSDDEYKSDIYFVEALVRPYLENKWSKNNLTHIFTF